MCSLLRFTLIVCFIIENALCCSIFDRNKVQRVSMTRIEWACVSRKLHYVAIIIRKQLWMCRIAAFNYLHFGDSDMFTSLLLVIACYCCRNHETQNSNQTGFIDHFWEHYFICHLTVLSFCRHLFEFCKKKNTQFSTMSRGSVQERILFIMAKYRCPNCNYYWEDVLIGYKLEQHCPNCRFTQLPYNWVRCVA